jgi:hypothetical protein
LASQLFCERFVVVDWRRRCMREFQTLYVLPETLIIEGLERWGGGGGGDDGWYGNKWT